MTMARGMTARPITVPRSSVAVRKRTSRRTPAILSAVVTTDKARLLSSEIRDLRSQLAPDPIKPLSQQRFSQLLGVSWSTIARWEAGGAIDSRHALKLARLQRVLTMLDDMVTREYRLAFFEQAHPLLMRLRPIDLLDTEEGMRAILRQLEAAATGSFA
jgi:DNA-binding transcriptional regulator YiaG